MLYDKITIIIIRLCTFNLYHLQLTREVKCFSFNVIQEDEVKETKPAFVVVYDYYKKGIPHSLTQ